MPKTLHISPLWDTASQTFRVAEATTTGLSGIRASDRETFERALEIVVPNDATIIISYPEGLTTITP